MKRNALCDGVHIASMVGNRERLGQPDAGKHMNKQYKKGNKNICRVQLVIAIISFICGAFIAGTRLFLIVSIGDNTISLISILKEILILYSAIIGIRDKSSS